MSHSQSTPPCLVHIPQVHSPVCNSRYPFHSPKLAVYNSQTEVQSTICSYNPQSIGKVQSMFLHATLHIPQSCFKHPCTHSRVVVHISPCIIHSSQVPKSISYSDGLGTYQKALLFFCSFIAKISWFVYFSLSYIV